MVKLACGTPPCLMMLVSAGTEQARSLAQTLLNIPYGEGGGEKLDVYIPKTNSLGRRWFLRWAAGVSRKRSPAWSPFFQISTSSFTSMGGTGSFSGTDGRRLVFGARCLCYMQA